MQAQQAENYGSSDLEGVIGDMRNMFGGLSSSVASIGRRDNEMSAALHTQGHSGAH